MKPIATVPSVVPFGLHKILYGTLALAALVLWSSMVFAAAVPVRLGSHTFTIADGFTIEPATLTDLVSRPVSASFDDQGRLYVTDSSGSNLPPSEQLKNPTARVLRLEDTNGDGRFDRAVVFADKVMFPQGCLWYQGSVYVAGPPSIWKFTDTNGDGVADQREEWFKGGTLTGCANDIHGPYLGPEGYIYWTKGAFAEQTHPLANGRKLQDRAAHILRSRPDGSGLDVIMTGGMDNPVEVAFTAEGEPVFTSTFIDFSQPGWRDGIGHAAYGAVFGKDHDSLEDRRVKRNGPGLTHPFVQFGAGAPTGLCRYQSDAFGSEYRDNLFASTFNLHKITRHQLRPKGATYASLDTDFVVSDNLDFHPTDVLEDADGSLLILDTGGWYKLCCPSSQLAKADVLGAIYRVRRVGAKALAGAERAAAYQRLTSPPTVRKEAPEVQLKLAVLRGDAKSAGSLRETLAAHARVSSSSASAKAGRNDAALVRNAVEGLARLGDRSAAPELFAMTSTLGDDDEALRQCLTFALVEIGNVEAAREALRSGDAAKIRAALIVLDQLSDAALKAEEVLSQLGSNDANVRRVASWIVRRHSDWGGALAGNFRARLNQGGAGNDAERAELQNQLAQFARDAAVQEVLGTVVADGAAPVAGRLVALRAMGDAGSSLKQTPAAWMEALTPVIEGPDASLQRQAVLSARRLPVPNDVSPAFRNALDHAGRKTDLPADLRLEALAAVPRGLEAVDGALFDFLRTSLESTQPVAMRAAACTTLARAKLTESQLNTLADGLGKVGPLELPKILPAFDRQPTEALGLRMLAALRGSRSLASLRPEILLPRLTNFPAVVQTQGQTLLSSLNVDAAKQAAHLEALLAEVHDKGDVRRGQTIFNSAKAACSSCHAIGYLGGKVGPDLTRISEARSERDLLESIVYPSASFVRSYEPILVTTRGGDEYSGVLRKDGADEIVLATGPNVETKLARADITEIRPGTVSVMPQGLDEQLSHQELADLLAFLRATRWGPR